MDLLSLLTYFLPGRQRQKTITPTPEVEKVVENEERKDGKVEDAKPDEIKEPVPNVAKFLPDGTSFEIQKDTIELFVVEPKKRKRKKYPKVREYPRRKRNKTDRL